MSTDEPTQAVTPAQSRPTKKLKPARKQVKPGDVEKKETVQTGKEYSQSFEYTALISSLITYDRHLVQQVGRWRSRRQLLKVSVIARFVMLGTNDASAK